MTSRPSYIAPILFVSGVFTSTMVYAALFPQAALQATFGEGLEGPLAEVIVRNWGALIALVGFLMMHGAIYPATRQAALVVASLSKAVFVALVLTSGRPYLHYGAGLAVAVDALMVAVFVGYLARSQAGAASRVPVVPAASRPPAYRS